MSTQNISYDDKDRIALVRYTFHGEEYIDVAKITYVYPTSRVDVAFQDGTYASVLRHNILIIDDTCNSVEDFKEKYPEEFI